MNWLAANSTTIRIASQQDSGAENCPVSINGSQRNLTIRMRRHTEASWLKALFLAVGQLDVGNDSSQLSEVSNLWQTTLRVHDNPKSPRRDTLRQIEFHSILARN
ncbi:MAG: hypothetical protein Aurels2KO_55610 [Aureliella sp.]